MRLSFGKKIIISYFLGFILFMAAFYPLAINLVKEIVSNSIYERSYQLIEKIQDAPTDAALVQKLKDQRYLIFFRVSLITDERKLLYDSYTKRLLGPGYTQKLALHPEVEEAFREGYGLHVGDSKLLRQRFVYIAESFDFHGKTYVLRIAFPYSFVDELARDVEIGFVCLAFFALLLFSLMTWFIIHRLTMPIQTIIQDLKPYQSGQVSTLPKIEVPKGSSEDDLVKLALTLNSLSETMQNHINSLEKERNEKEAVLESLVEGVVAVDSNMIVTYANITALKLLNVQKADLIGQPFASVQHKQCLELLVKCQAERRPLTDTLIIKRESESKIHLDLVAAPKKESDGAVLVMENKSEHYRLIEMRKNFVANASHELKTPITIIRGFAETLQDNPNLPVETCNHIMGKIVNNCKRMATLIKNLLTLTDVEHMNQSRMLDCNLSILMNNCCQTLRDLHTNALVNFEKHTDQSISLMADPLLLEMAFMNLLENAAKYSESPAQVTVSLFKEYKWAKLVIADKGVGIPEADLEHIFQRFYTVNKAHSRKLGGAGLGLSIVETIIEKHRGKISVVSELGVGTAFTVHLPLSLS
jgi:two-component system phosphate regulon sensor histidine kinase PhoR